MLLMQEPELLLVDEPVAGMTPQEIERTAELLLSLAGEHSVVVVEHDMDFVRSIARRVTVLHEGRVLAEGRHGPGAERSARHRGLSGSVSVLDRQGSQSVRTAAATRCGTSISPCPQGSRTCLMGRNGMGKTTLLKCIMGLLPAIVGRASRSTGTELLQRCPPRSARGSASATCRRGARFFRI